MTSRIQSHLILAAAVATVVGGSVLPARGGNLYWDINGSTPGAAGDGIAAATAGGVWDTTSPTWNTDSVGVATPGAWVAGETGVFSAGTNATMVSSIDVTGAHTIGGFDFQEGAVTLAGTGTFALTGTPVFNVGTSASGTIFNTISGTARWTKTGAGILDVRGFPNTNTGGVTINEGAVRIGNGNSEVMLGDTPTSTAVADWLILNNGTLRTANTTSLNWPSRKGIFIDSGGGTFNGIGNGVSFGTVFIASKISGTGTLTKAGNNILVLQNSNTDFTGKIKILGGEFNTAGNDLGFGAVPASYVADAITLDCGTGGALRASLAITIPANRGITLGASGGQFDTTGTTTINSVITGPGPLIKAVATSTGALILGAANTYAGNTTISVGTLRYGIAEALPSGAGKGSVTVTSTLDMNGFSGTINGLSGTGTVDTLVAGTPTLTVGGGDASSTFAGAIQNSAGTLSLVKTGAGVIALTGNNNHSGTTAINAGRLQAGKPASLPGYNAANRISVGGGGTVGVNVGGASEWSSADVNTLHSNTTFAAGGAIAFDTTGGNFDYSFSLSKPTTVAKLGVNTLTLSVANTHTGGTSVDAGTLVAAHPQALGTGTLSVANSASARAQANLATAVTVGGVSTSGTGKFDLTNNALVVKSSTLAAVDASVTQGYNNGDWLGGGLTSSTAATDPNGLTALGFVSNAELGATSFEGATGLDGDDILVKYTYYGDADLNGVVDPDDFNSFLAGFQDNTLPRTWVYGDFDYNNVIDPDDFNLFLAAFQFNGTPLSELVTSIERSSLSATDQQLLLNAVSAVPEPMTLGLLAFAACGLAARRRR